MKKVLFSLALLCGLGAAQAQTTPVAHWDMNDSVNDITGNGHNGIAHNVTPAAGADGVMGHAYYFNGFDSKIYIPESPDLNMSTGYSICARVKVQGYSSGACHANTIFVHGMMSPIGTGTYCMYFDDAPSGAGCGNPLDTASQCFMTGACATGAGLGSSSLSDYNYIPYIVSNTWYDVVVTFNDTAYRTYVNGVPMSVVYINTPGVHIGTYNAGASIGYDIFDSVGGYPYPFKGVIDDLVLYNYKLSDSAVLAYSHIHTLGANSLTAHQEFAVFPNPASDKLYLQHAMGTRVMVYNILGEKVAETQVATDEQQVDTKDLPAGTYVARLIADDGTTVSRRFIKL